MRKFGEREGKGWGIINKNSTKMKMRTVGLGSHTHRRRRKENEGPESIRRNYLVTGARRERALWGNNTLVKTGQVTVKTSTTRGQNCI
jgi:hypothetical protein